MGKIRDKLKIAIGFGRHRAEPTNLSSVNMPVKNDSRPVAAVRRIPQTKAYRASHRVYKKAHYHIAQVPHEHLMRKSKKYAQWHSWQFKKLHHGHVHLGILVSWTFLVIFLVGSSIGQISALSTWQQTDWAGGVGTSTANQYSSASNIDNSTSGQLSLSKTNNSYSNTSFDSDLTGWNGASVTQSGSFAHSGAGSALVTAGGVTSTKFNTASSYAATNKNRHLDGGDLNGDGRGDVAVATLGGVAIYFSNSDGTLAAASLQPGVTGLDYYDVKIADLNNDGANDIVATPDATQIKYSVYYNNGSGSFTRTDFDHSGSLRYCAVTVLDIDKNGWKDLAFACYLNSNTFYVFNNNSGGFTAEATLSGLPGSLGTYPVITSGDINGDSNSDIVLASNIQYACQFYYSLGTGGGLSTVATQTLTNCGNTAGTQLNGITVGDYNKDGKDDVAVPRRRGTGGDSTGDVSVVSVVFGSSGGTFVNQLDLATQFGFGQTQAAIKSVDIDNDGNLDIAASTYGYNLVAVYMGGGDGTFGAKEDYAPGQTLITDIAFTDLRGDGKPDLLVSHYNNPSAGTLITMLNRTVGNSLTQPLNLGNTSVYQIEAYARNVSGTLLTNADVELFSGGRTLTTTYTDAGSGWYKLTGTVTAVNAKVGYGVMVKQGKTISVDDVSVYKYASSGTLTSSIFDLGFGGDWGTLTFSKSGSGTAEVRVRSSNNSDMSGAAAFSGCPSITSGTDLTGQNCMSNNERYVQYEVTLNAASGNTPIFEDVSLQYGAWDTTPPTTNASNIAMKKSVGGSTVASNGWTNGVGPYFDWTAGADNGGGSGIKGYCLYLGTDQTANPVTTKGLLGTSPVSTDGACQFIVSGTSVDLATSGYIQTALSTSNSPYYLSVRAVDNAGNVIGSNAQFQFRFDNTAPTNPAYVSAPSQFVSSKDVTLTWPTSGGDAASDANSGLAGLQYKIGSTTWYGDGHNGAQDATDLLVNDGSYTTVNPTDFNNINEGNNTVYFRTWDQAGNVSPVYVTTAIKLNTSSPTPPQNVTATPSTNTTNNFAFSWSAPSSFQGSASLITYCYTINTLPTSNTCTFTSAGTTSIPVGPYATQPGDNTFYVVAKDEAGNINYATASSATFTANTSAPGIPLDTDIADVSIKSSSSWKLALTWNAPTNAGAGVANYRVYRSTDGTNFAQVATTSGTSYVDSGLSQTKYYYKIKACDSANNCGADGSTVNYTPTGKFTVPANLTADPIVSGVSTKKATVRWSTDRGSDSKISIGTRSGAYEPFQVASPSQVTAHEVQLSNLTPGTTYFAKATWTDEDGNTGSSSEFSFKTDPAPSTQEVTTPRITLNGAQIRFTSVSAAKVVIQYGKSDSFGGVKEISTSLSKSTYDTEITGLDDGTKYFYRLNTFDAEGNEYTGSTVLTFTTPARPRIQNLQFQPVDGEPTSTQKVSWQTNVPTSSLVRFSSPGSANKELSSSDLVTDHEMTIRDLLDDTDYTLVAESRDKDGNLATSDPQALRTALDTRPPKITEVNVETSIKGTGAEARGQIIVSWKTDEPSTSQVAYAEGTNASTFNNKTSEDTGLALEHVVVVSDLPTSRVFSVQPISKDNSGNEGSGEIKSAIIGRASDSVITVVLNTLRKVFGF